MKNALPGILLLCTMLSLSCKHRSETAQQVATGQSETSAPVPAPVSASQQNTIDSSVVPGQRTESNTSAAKTAVVAPEGPNYNYTVEPPKGWTIHDTVVQQLRIRLLSPPPSLAADRPAINILVASMNGSDIDKFADANIAGLKQKSPEVVLLRRGEIKVSRIDACWFTYHKKQNGTGREMIVYLVPLRGFAYIFTCGIRDGGMSTYRTVFDGIVQSFRG